MILRYMCSTLGLNFSPSSLLAMIVLSAVQSFQRILIHNAILFIKTSTMLGTTKDIEKSCSAGTDTIVRTSNFKTFHIIDLQWFSTLLIQFTLDKINIIFLK